eukprot:TRINITY_DN28089_c0_g1_i1.p2 TRINITY_DN28089_c0_g1~~TRINITY_DN28089_c0_g1_i1.p2  ORF type:complete len:148 (+),score=54.13 TRINITY_DN28089_c0_g1_i1:56-499(+)
MADHDDLDALLEDAADATLGQRKEEEEAAAAAAAAEELVEEAGLDEAEEEQKEEEEEEVEEVNAAPEEVPVRREVPQQQEPERQVATRAQKPATDIFSQLPTAESAKSKKESTPFFGVRFCEKMTRIATYTAVAAFIWTAGGVRPSP